jgi:hypothetical protein
MNDQAIAKHGRLGIASFVLSLVVLVTVVALFTVATAKYVRGTETWLSDEIVGWLWVAMAVLALISIVLGVIGALSKSSNRAFALLGIVISAATVAVSVALIKSGLSAGN